MMIVYFCALLLVVGGLVYMRLSSSSGGGDKPNTASTMLIDGTQSQKSWLLPSAAAANISVLPSFLLCFFFVII